MAASRKYECTLRLLIDCRIGMKEVGGTEMVDHIFGTQLSNRDFFIRRWRMEYPAFVDVCNALTDDRLDYRPHSASRSARELVALLVSLERSCVELCETGRG